MKKITKTLLVLIVILAILIAVFWLTKPKDNNEDLTPESIISKISSQFFDKMLKTEEGVSGWTLNNDNRICLQDSSYLISNIIEDIENINKQISSFFQSLSFTKNLQNTNPVESEFNNSTIGFERRDLKCTISWHIKDKIYFISCANLKEEDKVNYDTFYNLVNLDNDQDALVCVEKQIEEYTKGSISFSRTGAEWYAKKENNQWKLLLKTQDSLKCSFAEQLPDGFYTHDFCYKD